MSQNSASQIDSSTTTREPRLEMPTAEQGMSRDEADTSPAAAIEQRSADRENCAAPARLDEPPPRFRMNEKLRAEILSSELPDVMPVKCGQLEGELHLKRLGSGSRGPCILHNGVWLTPNQFECQGGQGYFRYWKRSIRHGTKPLDCYIKLGLIKLHYRFCACERCSEPITDAPQRLRLNKGKKPKRLKEGKDAAECPKDSRRRDSDSESLSGAESTSDEAVSGLEDVRGSKSNGQASCVTMADETALTDGTVWRGKKRRNRPEFFMTERDNDGKTKRSDSGDGKQSKGYGKRSPYKPRKRKEGANPDDNQQLLSSSEMVTAKLENCPSRGACHSPSGGHPNELLPLRVRQSRDLQLVASACADFSGSRALRSQNLSVPSKVPAVSTENKPHYSLSSSHVDWQSPKNSHHENGSPASTAVSLRARILAAVRKAEVENDVRSWSVDDVAAFVCSAGFRFQSSQFRQHLINGAALMRLEERHLLENLKLKLGPTLCLFSLIQGLQMGLASKMEVPHLCDYR